MGLSQYFLHFSVLALRIAVICHFIYLVLSFERGWTIPICVQLLLRLEIGNHQTFSWWIWRYKCMKHPGYLVARSHKAPLHTVEKTITVSDSLETLLLVVNKELVPDTLIFYVLNIGWYFLTWKSHLRMNDQCYGLEGGEVNFHGCTGRYRSGVLVLLGSPFPLSLPPSWKKKEKEKGDIDSDYLGNNFRGIEGEIL